VEISFQRDALQDKASDLAYHLAGTAQESKEISELRHIKE